MSVQDCLANKAQQQRLLSSVIRRYETSVERAARARYFYRIGLARGALRPSGEARSKGESVPASLELIKSILGPACPDDITARRILTRALEREVDPLRHIAISFALGEAEVMRRTARWIGLAFAAAIPPGTALPEGPMRLEALADIRALPARIEERDLRFIAPDYFDALKLRERVLGEAALVSRVCLVPEAGLRAFITAAASSDLSERARTGTTRKWPRASAECDLGDYARHIFVAVIVILLLALLVVPHVGGLWLLPFWLALLIGPATVRLLAVVRPHRPNAGMSRCPEDADLPIYSVMVPLRDEAGMVPQLFDALLALHYPPEKLDIKFVVEDRSPATVAAVEALLGDPRFSLIVVPDTLPRTKPKALNYALPLCRGEFVVVYDAEDTPDPNQLWKIAARFAIAPQTHCIQAQLQIDNGRESWLTAGFAAEYSGLFGVLLPALAKWGQVVPLGGTSNHFRIKTLRELGGWDAFNVTEDADLGLRLARRGHRIEVMATATLEEAPTSVRTWVLQRTRWIKGWMQTLIVHGRRPLSLVADIGLGRAIVLVLMMLGMVLGPLLHLVFLILISIRFAVGDPLLGINLLWGMMFCLALVIGYGSAILLNCVGLRRRNRSDLMPAMLALPFYWLLASWAAVRALRELIQQPYAWSKTPHRAVQRQGGDSFDEPGNVEAARFGREQRWLTARRAMAFYRKQRGGSI